MKSHSPSLKMQVEPAVESVHMNFNILNASASHPGIPAVRNHSTTVFTCM